MNFNWLVSNASVGTVYEPAIKFAQEKNRAKCDAYFKAMVEFTIAETKLDYNEVETIIRKNIGYFAGNYTLEERKLVLEYYNAHHPILPLKELTPKECFDLGKQMAEQHTIEQKIKSEINKK